MTRAIPGARRGDGRRPIAVHAPPNTSQAAATGASRPPPARSTARRSAKRPRASGANAIVPIAPALGSRRVAPSVADAATAAQHPATIPDDVASDADLSARRRSTTRRTRDPRARRGGDGAEERRPARLGQVARPVRGARSADRRDPDDGPGAAGDSAAIGGIRGGAPESVPRSARRRRRARRSSRARVGGRRASSTARISSRSARATHAGRGAGGEPR